MRGGGTRALSRNIQGSLHASFQRPCVITAVPGLQSWRSWDPSTLSSASGIQAWGFCLGRRGWADSSASPLWALGTFLTPGPVPGSPKELEGLPITG